MSSLTVFGSSTGPTSGGGSLTPTGVKTTGYTASPSDFIPADASAGAVVVTLPSAPADKAQVTVKKIDASTNAVSITRGGSDVFNKAGGSTSLSLTLQNQSAELQYAASIGVWYVKASDTPVAAIKASLQATTPVTVASVVTGSTVHHAHRGVGRMHHENALEALQLAAALGHKAPDGGDFQYSADGKAISNHASTIAAGDLTGPNGLSYAGSVNALSARGFKQMKVGKANYSYASSFTNIADGTTMTAEDYAAWFAAHPGQLWLPEIKDARCAPEMLDLITRYGLKDRTIIGSFTLTDVATLKAAGIPIVWFRSTTSGYSLAAALAAGVDYLAYDYTSGTWTPTIVQAAYDAGIKLWAYQFQRRHQIADEVTRVGRPLAIVTSDFGIYSGKTTRYQTTDPYAEGVPFPGQIPSSANPGTFTRASAGKFSIVGASRVLQGWACADVTDWATGTVYAVGDIVAQDTGLWICNTAHTSSAAFATDTAFWTVYKLTFTTTFETVGAAGSTGIVVTFGCASDKDPTAGTAIQDSGWLLSIAKNGTSGLSRWNGGVNRQTSAGPNNTAGGAVARVDGATEQWTVEFLTGANTGKVKVSNVTGATSATQTDNATGGTTPRRGYLTFGTTASDLDVSFKGVALT